MMGKYLSHRLFYHSFYLLQTSFNNFFISSKSLVMMAIPPALFIFRHSISCCLLGRPVPSSLLSSKPINLPLMHTNMSGTPLRCEALPPIFKNHAFSLNVVLIYVSTFLTRFDSKGDLLKVIFFILNFFDSFFIR